MYMMGNMPAWSKVYMVLSMPIFVLGEKEVKIEKVQVSITSRA